MIDAVYTMWKEEGIKGWRRGMRARVLFHSVSASLTWASYEFMKDWLGAESIE